MNTVEPFASLERDVRRQSELRAAITAAYRRPESECVNALLRSAAQTSHAADRISALALDLVGRLRAKARSNGVENLIQEYSLSSEEGVALMCLAEALLRIPDVATRDALIRDKISGGDWRAHLGHSPSFFVNAATWGLVITGKLTAPPGQANLSSSLVRLVSRGGEPVIRKAVDLAMRLMGEQFVTGQTIDSAIENSRRMEARGFRYSYDMLGEAAATAEDAARYLSDYEKAIHQIGKHAAQKGIYEGPGISIKLSALHPRYSRNKINRVKQELLPRLKGLALLAKRYEIGLNIDAEEADRLDLSLDLLEALCFDEDLSGWNGIGFVVQAYQKRCAFVIDWIIDLARRSKRRIMVRLVKGAYWDSEIKRAQIDGMKDFPVFTRKVHTDISYLASARKLLAVPDAVFPQFATHNAQTLASVIELAGPNFYHGQYEFQCLHGMGEALYEEVVGPDRLARPCRIYAPVGSHETLLAYLVRRLLENGANTSFVNRIADLSVDIKDLIADPVTIAQALRPIGAPHDKIAKPLDLYGPERRNSSGIDLSDERDLLFLAEAVAKSAALNWVSEPRGATSARSLRLITNPADAGDIVGKSSDANSDDIAMALTRAEGAVPHWRSTAAASRAHALRGAADQMEAELPTLVGLLVREAGKSFANAIAEVREAVDFLRYYALEATKDPEAQSRMALGAVVCISPWNFPLAIFVGQIAAALAAGNPVLAKPAEETPLVAAEAVLLLHEAGIPGDVLQLLPGGGEVGAALVADPRVQGVMFTGSTEVARLIQRQLAERLGHDGRPVPLIAETGGQNALVVDSSALPEQVVTDVIASAFDSAGQRCSALRVMCVQEEAADRILSMLKGAMAELEVGNPCRLSVDVGPVITREAKQNIRSHVESMRSRGHVVHEVDLSPEIESGNFIPPTIIEISRMADIEREVFGPILHVIRYSRENLSGLIEEINASGYGLTFGIHSRINETVVQASKQIAAGNIYINRNMIGAVVGVQPFGGSRLSGTGPKAGGPLYLGRLFAVPRRSTSLSVECRGPSSRASSAYIDWLLAAGHAQEARHCGESLSCSLLGAELELPGPVGERNTYFLKSRGPVAALGRSDNALLMQVGAILATGNQALIEMANPARRVLDRLPSEVADEIRLVESWVEIDAVEAVLFDGSRSELLALSEEAARRPGPIIPILSPSPADGSYDLDRLLKEVSISINTAAAGGNAGLMSIG